MAGVSRIHFNVWRWLWGSCLSTAVSSFPFHLPLAIDWQLTCQSINYIRQQLIPRARREQQKPFTRTQPPFECECVCVSVCEYLWHIEFEKHCPINVLANGHIKYSMWKMLITYWAQNSLAARLVQRPQTNLPPSLSLSLPPSTRKPNQHQPKSRKLREGGGWDPSVWHVPFPFHLLPRWVNKHYTILIVFPFRMRNNNNNNNCNKNSNDSEQQQEVALISVCLPLRCALIKCQRVAGAGQRAEGANGQRTAPDLPWLLPLNADRLDFISVRFVATRVSVW